MSKLTKLKLVATKKSPFNANSRESNADSRELSRRNNLRSFAFDLRIFAFNRYFLSLTKLLSPILIIFILLSNIICLANSEIKISASVDKDKISLDDFLNFTIKIEGIDNSYKNPKIKLPSLENNFTIVASSQSNNISLKGDKIDMAWQMQYTLSPKNEGTVKIDSAEVIYKGKTFKTEPITITVGPFSTPKSRRDVPQQEQPQKVPWQEKEGILI